MSFNAMIKVVISFECQTFKVNFIRYLDVSSAAWLNKTKDNVWNMTPHAAALEKKNNVWTEPQITTIIPFFFAFKNERGALTISHLIVTYLYAKRF